MTDYENIDKQFSDQQADWEGRPSEAAWHRLSDKLDAHGSGPLNRRRTIYRWSAAASVALLLAFSIYMFNNSFQASGFQAGHKTVEVPEHAGINTDRGEMGAEIPSPGTATSEYTPADEKIIVSRSEAEPTAGPVVVEEAIPSLSDMKYTVKEEVESITAENGNGNPSGLAASGSTVEGITLPDADAEFAEEDEAAAEFIAEEAGIEEMPALTDAVVANRAGIEAEKAQQQQRGDKRKKADDRAREAFQAADMAKEKSDYLEYEVAGDQLDEFISTTLIILVPTEKKNNCRFVAFEVEDDNVYLDRCQEVRSAVSRSAPQPLDSSPALSRLFDIDRETLRSMEKDIRSGPCLPSAKSVQIIYRSGTALSYNDETIRLPLQEFCLPEEAKELVRELKDLRDSYIE